MNDVVAADPSAPDHRRLGRDLDLYAGADLVGPGLPLFLPDGAAIVTELERYVLEAERRAGCRRVRTPPLAKRALYERSGHWEHFSEDVFPPMDLGGDDLVLRPVLCPHHALVFGSRARSYRELPLRLAELDRMFRRERSGVVGGGLLRVRAITLNDAHTFCAPEQAADEIALALRMIEEAYDVLGIRPAYAMVAVRGPGKSYAGSDESWERAEALLWEALALHGMSAERVEGEAAFYGPKIDIQVADARGREFTLSTVQADLVMPERFDLSYVAADGSRHRPVIVHRSVLSSMERMVAHLLESYGGALPPWLAPVQAVVLPVGPDDSAAAVELASRLEDASLRVVVDDRAETLAARMRAAWARKAPYVAVVGPAEAREGTVSVRVRGVRGSAVVPVERVVASVPDVVTRRLRAPAPV